MIANIKHAESVEGIINYVYSKIDENKGVLIGSNILDFPSRKELAFHLKYQGEQKSHAKPFTHISISLALNDPKISDDYFNQIASDYLTQMGYGNQPYAIVKHTDTKHQHVHIISTSVQEDGNLIFLSNDRIRSLNISRKLEDKYNLVKVSNIKNKRISILPNTSKFSIEQNIKGILQTYKPRNFTQFQDLLIANNITSTLNQPGKRKGILFHLNNEDGSLKNTKPLAGSAVNKNFSYNKLNTLFEKNQKSKIFLSHRLRLTKQINSSLDLFTTINSKDFADILSKHNIDLKENRGEADRLLGYTIYDKSGYILKASEIDRDFTLSKKFSTINESNSTTLNINSTSFKNLCNSIFDESIKASFENSKMIYESEFIEKTTFNDLTKHFNESDSFNYLANYIVDENEIKMASKHLQSAFEIYKSKQEEISKKEINVLDSRGTSLFELREALKTPVNDLYLINSLGLQAKNNGRNFDLFDIRSNFNRLEVDEKLKHLDLPNTIESKYSNLYSQQLNSITLAYLFSDSKEIPQKTSFHNLQYLPLYFPDIYDNLNDDIKSKYETLVNNKYGLSTIKEITKNSETPSLFVNQLTNKGFKIFKNEEGKFLMYHINSERKNAIELDDYSHKFISSSYKLEEILKSQDDLLLKYNNLSPTETIKTLWLNSLLEDGKYDYAAYIMIEESISPIMDKETFDEHKENGLNDAIDKQLKSNYDQDQLNRLKNESYQSKNNFEGGTFKQEMKGKTKKKKKRRFNL